MKKIRRRKQERQRNPYPALALWRQRERGKPATRWVYDDLWRSACAEMEAMEHRNNNPEREETCQVDAITVMLFGNSTERHPRVTVNAEWARRYVARLAEYRSHQRRAA